jgi:hypothetical protein
MKQLIIFKLQIFPVHKMFRKIVLESLVLSMLAGCSQPAPAAPTNVPTETKVVSTSTPAPAPLPDLELPFVDDFSDPASGWVRLEGTRVLYVTDPGSEGLYIWAKQARMLGTYVLARDNTPPNISFDVVLLGKDPAEGTFSGPGCRIQDDGSGIYFLIDPVSAQYSVVKVEEGSLDYLLGPIYSPDLDMYADAREKVKIGIVCAGHAFLVGRNGSYDIVFDETFEGGKVGFGVLYTGEEASTYASVVTYAEIVEFPQEAADYINDPDNWEEVEGLLTHGELADQP